MRLRVCLLTEIKRYKSAIRIRIRILCAMLYWQLYSPQNPTTDNKVGSVKQGL